MSFQSVLIVERINDDAKSFRTAFTLQNRVHADQNKHHWIERKD